MVLLYRWQAWWPIPFAKRLKPGEVTWLAPNCTGTLWEKQALNLTYKPEPDHLGFPHATWPLQHVQTLLRIRGCRLCVCGGGWVVAMSHPSLNSVVLSACSAQSFQMTDAKEVCSLPSETQSPASTVFATHNFPHYIVELFCGWNPTLPTGTIMHGLNGRKSQAWWLAHAGRAVLGYRRPCHGDWKLF